MAKRKIFLSYSRVDAARVRSLHDRLSHAGFDPWMDVKKRRPGRWERSTRKAVGTSDFFLACLTKSSFDSEGFFKREIDWALANVEKKRKSDTYLIPVRLEDCEVPGNLQNFQWFDLYKRGGWDSLLKALSAPLPSRGVSPGLGLVVGFVTGVLGNLLADLIRQGGLGNPFTPRQVIVTILMTLVGLCAGRWAARRPLSLLKLSQSQPGRQLLANVSAFVLLATLVAALLSTGLREWFIRTRGCSEVEVSALELELNGGRQKFSGRDITIQHLDLYGRQNLAGSALLSNLSGEEGCVCVWSAGVNELTPQQLSSSSVAKDCIFSILPLQSDVREIDLTLNVGRRAGPSGFETVKSFDFKIKVQ